MKTTRANEHGHRHGPLPIGACSTCVCRALLKRRSTRAIIARVKKHTLEALRAMQREGQLG